MFADLGLDGLHGCDLLVPQPCWELMLGGQVGVAGLGRDGEAGRHRQPQPGHFKEIGAFAAQKSTDGFPVFGVDGGFHCVQPVEEKDPL